jgi:hypothetical protein
MLSAATRPIAQVSQGPELVVIYGTRGKAAVPTSRKPPEAGLLSHRWFALGWAAGRSRTPYRNSAPQNTPRIPGMGVGSLYSNDQASQHLTLKKMGAGAGRKEARQARRAGISMGRRW